MCWTKTKVLLFMGKGQRQQRIHAEACKKRALSQLHILVWSGLLWFRTRHHQRLQGHYSQVLTFRQETHFPPVLRSHITRDVCSFWGENDNKSCSFQWCADWDAFLTPRALIRACSQGKNWHILHYAAVCYTSFQEQFVFSVSLWCPSVQMFISVMVIMASWGCLYNIAWASINISII